MVLSFWPRIRSVAITPSGDDRALAGYLLVDTEMQIGDPVEMRYPEHKHLVGAIAELREGTVSIRAKLSFGETTIVIRSDRLRPCGANRWSVDLYQAKVPELVAPSATVTPTSARAASEATVAIKGAAAAQRTPR